MNYKYKDIKKSATNKEVSEKELQNIKLEIADKQIKLGKTADKLTELTKQYDNLNETVRSTEDTFERLSTALDIAKNSQERNLDMVKQEYEDKKEQIIKDYQKEIEQNKIDIQEDILSLINSYNEDAQAAQKEIDENKQAINKFIEIRKIEQEREEKQHFYRLQISDKDIADVEQLMTISKRLNKPDILLKLVYKTYFEGAMNDLIGRVVGPEDKSGIYRITNTIDKKEYVGQTISFKNRWRTHLKRGLGIEAATSNKLYTAMKESGVWNFTFEVLEECEKADLNKNEKKWIETLQTNTYGYNMKGGNS